MCLKCRTDMFATGVRTAHSRGDHTNRGHIANRRACSAEAGRGRVPVQARVDLFRVDHHVGRYPHGHRPVLSPAVGHQTPTEEVHPVNAGHAVDLIVMERKPHRHCRTIENSAYLLYSHTHIHTNYTHTHLFLE